MRKMIWMLLVIAVFSTTGFAQDEVTDGRAKYHVFPQLADGRFSDGTSYRSTMLVSNDRFPVTCTWDFSGMKFPEFGQGDGSSYTFTLPANKAIRINTPNTGPFKTGYAELVCDLEVTAQILFSYISASGVVLSEATVFSSPPSSIAQLIYDVKPGVYLGVAIVNNSDHAKDYKVFTSEAFQQTITIPARTQVAKFINEWFPTIPAQYFGVFGAYTIGPDQNDVYMIGLRYTGQAFTTLPVTSITP